MERAHSKDLTRRMNDLNSLLARSQTDLERRENSSSHEKAEIKAAFEKKMDDLQVSGEVNSDCDLL